MAHVSISILTTQYSFSRCSWKNEVYRAQPFGVCVCVRLQGVEALLTKTRIGHPILLIWVCGSILSVRCVLGSNSGPHSLQQVL